MWANQELNLKLNVKFYTGLFSSPVFHILDNRLISLVYQASLQEHLKFPENFYIVE
jgi:hypothetical protein